MENKNVFTYKGFYCDEAEEFFKGKVKEEQREGLAVSGHFVKLKNGKTCLPYKGDVFTKDANGDIYLYTIH
mgnify:FL=1